ncbi:MAG: ribosome-binding factor A [Alphaproteobacteria bacterium]|nr:ribosome-binding factor A [Alphaproteobacteria bacterium]MBE8219693.1 ribosome-binding factor A [Alphaproteobacteria bacterium]
MARQKTTNEPSQRQLRVGEMIRQRLADSLSKGDFILDGLDGTITVTEVRMTPDLRYARAFIMPLGGGDVGASVAVLNDNVGRYKKQALQGLRLKYVPSLTFVADMSFERGAAMDKILSDLPPKNSGPPQTTTPSKNSDEF